MGGKCSTVEQKLAQLGGRHGVVTRRELLRVGVSDREIEGRVGKGSLVREYSGVYSVGHKASTVEARYLAAVKACGDGAVLSGRAAGWLFGVLKGKPPPPEVTAPTYRRVAGVRTRRSKLHALDVSVHRGIPTTTVPRTLVDLAATLSLTDLARACHEAGVRYRTTPRHVDRVLRRRPNAPGARNLRRVMHGDEPVLLSALERGFIALLRREGLLLPLTNRPVGGRYVDCRWPDRALTVELDSYAFHNSRHSWEEGYERERQAYAREDRFRRYTWHDVFEDPTRMLAELRALLV